MTTAELPAELIYSELGSDPAFGPIVSMYVDEMPGRVEDLLLTHAAGDVKELQRKAHQLKGSSGSYGFREVTPQAAALEDALKSDAPLGDVESALEELVAVCQRVRAGSPPSN